MHHDLLSQSGRTVVYRAVKNANVEVLRYLLASGASADVRDKVLYIATVLSFALELSMLCADVSEILCA